MNNCSKCNQSRPKLPQSVVEIINPCDPVLFHKVLRNANLGDDTAENGTPPEELNYKNVLLVYEANNHVYLYSSDGVPTQLPTGETDLKAIKEQLAQQGIDIDNLQTELATETTNREQADTGLQDSIDTLTDNLESEAHARLQEDTALGMRITNNETNITNLQTNLEEITTELQGDIASEALAREEADSTLQTNIDAINTNLNQEVEKETDFTTDTSTVTVKHTKVNLSNNDTNITTDPLPVADGTQAGVMNTSMFQALQNNSENIDSILNGAVALTGISADPTQEELTTAWETATGKTNLINRASIYDITNSKVWYYYENISQWEPVTATGEGEVSVSTFTNNTAGIIKGSENDGQVFAEADGTGSVVGWDGLKHDVENLVELLDTNPIPKVLTAYTTSDISGKVYSVGYINKRLDANPIHIGPYATNTASSSGIAIGNHANTVLFTSGYGGIAIGAGTLQNRTTATSQITNEGIAIGYGAQGYQSIAIGYTAQTTASGQVAIGNSAKCKNQNTTALGFSTNAEGNSNVAIGSYSHSTTDRPYAVSFGNPSGLGGSGNPTTRYLTNITAGENDTDAVNVKQMKDYVADNASSTLTATPVLNVADASNIYFQIDGKNGATTPQVGTMVLLQLPNNTIETIDASGTTSTMPLPLDIASGIGLAYTGGEAYNIKTTPTTTSSTANYPNLTDVAGQTNYVLMFDGQEWLLLFPAVLPIMTPTEFEAAWEAA